MNAFDTTPFGKWLDTFLTEKGIDPDEHTFNVLGPEYGTNVIPMGCVIEAIMGATAREQAGIKAMLVKIDFANAKVVPYFKHLAQALAQ